MKNDRDLTKAVVFLLETYVHRQSNQATALQFLRSLHAPPTLDEIPQLITNDNTAKIEEPTVVSSAMAETDFFLRCPKESCSGPENYDAHTHVYCHKCGSMLNEVFLRNSNGSDMTPTAPYLMKFNPPNKK